MFVLGCEWQTLLSSYLLFPLVVVYHNILLLFLLDNTTHNFIRKEL